MYLHKTKNGHYTPPCCYFSGELEVVECLPQTFSCGMMVGDIDLVEYGNAKADAGLPIFNYSVACDSANRTPLFYELYSGSLNDVSQLIQSRLSSARSRIEME